MAGARQDARIAKLEAQIEIMVADRQRVQEDINSKLMALGRGMNELMAAVYHLDPGHDALARARHTLADVFPLQPTPDHHAP